MADDKDLLKKMANILEKADKRKITDFDTGLLYDVFTPITGTSEERYEKWSARLVNVASRLENIHLNEKTQLPILKKIDAFFDGKLGEIDTDVSDFSEKDRIIKLNISGRQGDSSCVPESLGETLRSIREEQYNVLAFKAKKLVYKAMAQLKKELTWHEKKQFVLMNIPVIGTISIGEGNDAPRN